MTIKAVVFDLGGVLIKDPVKNSFFKKWTWTKSKVLRTKFGSGELSIKSFISQGAKIMNLKEKYFITGYNNSYGNIRLNKPIVKMFLSIKTPKYILSDTNPLHAPLLKRKLKEVFSSAKEV